MCDLSCEGHPPKHTPEASAPQRQSRVNLVTSVLSISFVANYSLENLLLPWHPIHSGLSVTRTKRTFICLLTVATLFAWADDAPKRPRLILAIVIDQFRYDYLQRFRQDYTSGLKRMLDQGAVFTDAHYLHAATVTAAGHSTFLSGATPSVSGIIGNEWFDRASNQPVTSVFDPKSKLVGGVPGAPGSSPRRLLVSTVGDEIKMHGIESRIIGVSIKDRSAILPVGHMADGAYWYDPDSNHWVT